MADEKQQEIVYEEKDLILFEEGIFGFEEYKKFLLLAIEDNDNGDMLYLQSVDEIHLSFLLINPFLLKADYEPMLPDADMKALAVENAAEDLAYYTLCVIKETPEDSTVNLKCPVVVNVKNRQARQVILDDSAYGLRHKLSEFADKEGAVC